MKEDVKEFLYESANTLLLMHQKKLALDKKYGKEEVDKLSLTDPECKAIVDKMELNLGLLTEG